VKDFGIKIEESDRLLKTGCGIKRGAKGTNRETGNGEAEKR
jgi:hypothetical protein